MKLWLRATAVALVSIAWLPACPKPDVLNLRSLTSEDATARVLNVARRHERMAGVVKARLPGMQGMIVSADLDVALEPEARVSVAVRSFFDQPMQMLVTDGNIVTVFDATQGAPVFLRGPVSDRTLSRVLPLPLWPRELVEIMLARPPLDARGRLTSVNEEAGTYEVRLESFGHGPIELVVRGQDDVILEWTQFKKDGRRLLHARYHDHQMVGDVALARKWTLTRLDTAPGDPMGQAIEVLALDLEHNGKPFDDAAFRLDPPPGTPLGPL